VWVENKLVVELETLMWLDGGSVSGGERVGGVVGGFVGGGNGVVIEYVGSRVEDAGVVG